MPRSKGRSELVQPETTRVELCTVGDIFQVFEKMCVGLAASSGEQEIAIFIGRPLPRFLSGKWLPTVLDG
jgi:hypothetical protein